MASFDRIDGLFVARCTFEERFIFQRNDWTFDRTIKRWVTPDIERARNIADLAVGAAKTYIANVAAMKEALVAASWAEDSDMDIPCPEGLAYMPFQKAGVEYAASREHVLVADAPGLGKTVQAIGIHNLKGFRRILVVCPASLKVNWSREWRKWDVHGLTVGIAETKSRTKQTNGVKTSWTEALWPDTQVVIVNYDLLEKFNDQITAQSWDMLVCDEAHLLKTATTIRAKCVFGGKKPAKKQGKKVVEKAKKLGPVRAKHNVFLTGTPILSQPSELWTLVQACDPTGLGRDWNRFVDQYCDAYPTDFGLDVSGASNIEELNRLLRERFMVRRDKQAVLKELPPKRRELIILPHDKLEKPLRSERSRVEKALLAFEQDVLGLDDTDPDFYYISAIESLGERLSAALDAQGSEEPNWEAAIRTLSEPDQLLFTELSMAREEVARAKVGMVTEHVVKQVQCGEPVILFAHHKSVVTDLVSRLRAAGLRVGEITGSVPSAKRQAVVDMFQNGELDVVVGNILAMGVGFTMTISSLVIFAELDWVPALIEQAEDRAWRHGQLNAVLIQHLVVDGSIEARMAQAIVEKMEVIRATLDNRIAA
jgi:SNF2 family DNA or RNA helicase